MLIPQPTAENVRLVWPCLLAIFIAEIITVCVNTLTGAILYFTILFLSYFHTAFYYMQNLLNLYPVMISIPLFRVINLAMPVWQISYTNELKDVRLIVTISLIIMIFIKELADTALKYCHDIEYSPLIFLGSYIDMGIVPSLCVFIFIFISRLQVALN